MFDRKGQELCALDRLGSESLSVFRQRANSEAQSLPGAARVVVGGLGSLDGVTAAGELPRLAVTLPDVPLHPSQREAVTLVEASRRVALVAGRRWGKSTVIVTLAIDYALSGRNVAIFAPTYRLQRPLLDAVVSALAHLPGVSVNKTLGEIQLAGGGAVDFWPLTSPAELRAGGSITYAWSTRRRTTRATSRTR
jgi:hypothetical protein